MEKLKSKGDSLCGKQSNGHDKIKSQQTLTFLFFC